MHKSNSRGINRRTFIRSAAYAPAALVLADGHQTTTSSTAFAAGPRARSFKADLVIIGGGLGGCAAALSALRRGKTVIMTEETIWLGGQSTSQAVPPDENKWIETFGGTASYQDYRTRIRDYYRRNYPLTDQARSNPRLNPGGGYVSAVCHEARVSVAVLEEMLAPFRSNGALTVLTRHVPTAVDVDGDYVRGVVVRDLERETDVSLEGAYVLDATENGGLLPLARAEYVTGAEAKSDTGEFHAADEARPQNMQAFTWCFAIEHVPGADFTIDKPATYDFWREYVPAVTPPWSGRLLSLDTTHPHTLKPRTQHFDPTDSATERGWWKYRRILDPASFVEGFAANGISLVNWPQNDYLLGNPFENSPEEAARHLEGSRQLSLSLFYWLQTEAPRPDGGTGWPGLRLRGDAVGTPDGLAMAPYIRESRRMRTEFTVLEQHVGKAGRMAHLGIQEGPLDAEQFPDSVGIGYYRIDLHPSTGGDNYIDVESLPFQIPLGALIHRRLENLLPACKNLGVTHITNGCYRLHPVEWGIGEAAGALAAYCLQKDARPRQVRNDTGLLAEYQKSLESQGVRLAWPEEVRSAKA